jgi:uncharacterized protein (DUF58 family)
MLSSMLPSRILIALFATLSGLLLALEFTRLAQLTVVLVAVGAAIALLAALAADLHLSGAQWQQMPLELARHLPHAFALGEAVSVRVTLENPGGARRRGRYYELADPSMLMPGMPLRFTVAARGRQTLEFDLKPTARGMKSFGAGQIFLRSSLGLLDWNLRIGASESRRVFPDFKRQAAFARLATGARLSELGMKSVRRRGSGLDFDQLVEYRAGEPIRHVDWKATLKYGRPMTRSFQDGCDQCVMFLLDCGRRMCAGDSQSGIGAGHFDQSLDALMLLASVALSSGDAVGALTFGTLAGAGKRFAPRKGRQTLNALMAELGDVEPSPVFSDYTAAAADLMQRRRKRSLVVVITSCRDEDFAELAAALRLLCSRHRVLIASLREEIVGQIAAQPLARRESVLEVAAAHEYRQRREDLLSRLAAAGATLIDCEPRALGVELVNRYTSLKRTGAL